MNTTHLQWLLAVLLCSLLTVELPAAEDAVIPVKAFQCQALEREVNYSVFVPPGEKPAGGWPLVLLLHGAGRNHRTLADDPVCREVILKQEFVIVFADGKGGWYLDSPVEPASRYQSMVRELLDHARKTLPVSAKPEQTGICGWSMGGYGAMRFAQTFPDQVGAVATTIALLEFPNPALPRHQNHSVPKVFGSDVSVWPKHNCMSHAGALRGKDILIVATTEAFDLQMNRNFHAQLEAVGIPHSYVEVEGGHVFPAVQATVPLLFEFMARRL
jgi:S-formylglutathione hydrolase FrmB